MSQIGSNKLKKNFNGWAIDSIINNTKNNEKPIMGWKIVAGKKITVDVVFHIIRKFRNEIVIRAVGQQSKSKLADLSVGVQKLNFYLPEDLVLFQSEVKKIDRNGDVIIRFPKMIAQVDRRKHMRLFVENGIKVKSKFSKTSHGQRATTQTFEKKCFDISAGGFSFIISKSENNFFSINDKIENIELTLGTNRLGANATIVNLLEIEPSSTNELIYKGIKVSCKLDSPAPRVIKQIDDFVFNYIKLDEAI